MFYRDVGIVLCSGVLICSQAWGNEHKKHHSSATSAPPPVIEEVVIRVHPVFDESNPDENNALFRLVNRLHINTKPKVIKKDLTFKQGDPADKHLLAESERRLRERRYFASAKVTSTAAQTDSNSTASPANATPPETTKVVVDVREVWTLVPKLTYSTAGGSTHYGYGLYDSNFLGLGKSVKIEHDSTTERTSDTIAYRDPNFANQKQLSFAYSDNSDGQAQEFHFSNPFRSIRTPWSAGVDYENYVREDSLFDAGEEAWRFGHDNRFYSLFYGVKLDGSNDDRTHRLSIGFDDVSAHFYPVPLQDTPNTDPNPNVDNDPYNTPNIAPSFTLPYDRDYQILWLEYSYLHDRFIEASNVQQINRIEDINLGSQFRWRLGQVHSSTPELDNATLLALDYTKAFQLSPTQLLTSQWASSGFYNRNGATQSLTSAALAYHWQNFSRGQFYVLASEVYGKNLFADTPLELGGDTGLRGYPARFIAGEHLRLLTIEQRYFGEKEWFSLFHMGAAVFYDQGQVWGSTAVPQTYQQTLRDVGIGLRISGTRTGGREEGIHNIAHIDLSYPLDGGKDIDKYQMSVKIKTSF
jgi:outer membrane protein assembly factor BamA